MVQSRVRRQLGILSAVVILTVGLTAATGAVNRASADPRSTATCGSAHSVSSSIALNGGVFFVNFGLTGRTCTDGHIVWTYSSAYPSSCWVAYPRILVVTGACGYAGDLSTNFRYIATITAKNYSLSVVHLALEFLLERPLLLPGGQEFTCTVTWTYTPTDVTRGATPSASGNCGNARPIG